jgi:hypothetical protein
MTIRKITDLRLGARFPGRCPVCGSMTGSKDYQLSGETLLGKDGDKFVVVHATCAGWRVKSKVSGGKSGSGPSTVEVSE